MYGTVSPAAKCTNSSTPIVRLKLFACFINNSRRGGFCRDRKRTGFSYLYGGVTRRVRRRLSRGASVLLKQDVVTSSKYRASRALIFLRRRLLPRTRPHAL